MRASWLASPLPRRLRPPRHGPRHYATVHCQTPGPLLNEELLKNKSRACKQGEAQERAGSEPLGQTVFSPAPGANYLAGAASRTAGMPSAEQQRVQEHSPPPPPPGVRTRLPRRRRPFVVPGMDDPLHAARHTPSSPSMCVLQVLPRWRWLARDSWLAALPPAAPLRSPTQSMWCVRAWSFRASWPRAVHSCTAAHCTVGAAPGGCGQGREIGGGWLAGAPAWLRGGGAARKCMPEHSVAPYFCALLVQAWARCGSRRGRGRCSGAFSPPLPTRLPSMAPA